MKTTSLVASCVATALLLTNPLTHAEEYDPLVITITASRTAKTVDESLASVTVIKRSDIERSQAQGLLEILSLEAGVDIARTGGPGQQTSLFLRGTNSNHTLVLIDGVRASSATTGSFAWAHMPVSQIERIEIVRGPRASLYGSDAIGGVIQIFTRKPAGASARLEAGSFGSSALQLGWAGGGKVRYNVNVDSRKSSGFSATNENYPYGSYPDDDGYDNQSVSAGLSAYLSETVKLDVKGWYSDGQNDFDSGTMDSLNQTLNASITALSGDRWTQTFRIGLAQDELYTTAEFYGSAINTDRSMAEWQHDLMIGQSSLLSLGLSHVSDEAMNVDTAANTVTFDQGTENNALFANWQTVIRANDIQMGLRYDDHSTFGGEATGQLAWGRDISEKVRLKASVGTAFRSPTINELYHPGYFGFYAGNPDLTPETSISQELGLRYATSSNSHLNISLYETRIDDLIAFQGTNSQAINIDEARIRGLEINHDTRRGLWDYKTRLTLQTARDEQADTDLLRRADKKLSLRAQRQLAGSGHIGAEVLLSSDRMDAGDITLPGYGVLNINASYPLTTELTLEGRVENLLDKEYELASGYNTPELSAFVAIRYQAK